MTYTYLTSPIYQTHSPLLYVSLSLSLPPQVLEKGGPYPQVILPQFGGYWIEDAEAPVGTPTSSESSFCEEEEVEDGGGGRGGSPGAGHTHRLECNGTARAYRKHFLGRVSCTGDMCVWVCVCVLMGVCVSLCICYICTYITCVCV